MIRFPSLGGLVLLGETLAATAGTPDPRPPPEPGWTMPWQLGPAPREGAEGERPSVTYLPGYGYVRATPEAMRGLYEPLADAPGRNVIVEPCRLAVERASLPLGAIRVEAASGGPQSKVAPGVVEAPVTVRVTYARDEPRLDYEVRVAVLLCRVDRRGEVLGATVRRPEAP